MVFSRCKLIDLLSNNSYPLEKNGGTCFDNEGTEKFGCTCTPQYLGDRCEIDRCDFYKCQNNGICIVTVINGSPTPECECPGNYGGATCNLDLCLDIECGNGICIDGTCQCDEDYVNNGNICEDICEGIDCGTGGYCKRGICSCDDGYANVGNRCVDICEGIDCGSGGYCSGGICSCQTGYVKIGNFCEETCALNPCKELIKIRRCILVCLIVKLIDINIENMNINTEYCFDANGSAEFKCECNEGFDGKRCEDVCSLECGINGSCANEINSTTGIKQSKCLCTDNFTGLDSHLDTNVKYIIQAQNALYNAL